MLQISPSQLNEIRICTARYHYKRVRKLPDPRKLPVVYGSALDHTVERMLIDKNNGGIHQMKTYQSIVVSKFNELAKKAIITDSERKQYLDYARSIVANYYANELPHQRALTTQEVNKFETDFFRVYQIFDMVTMDDVVVDYKAPLSPKLKRVGDKWQPKTFDNVIQLYCYHHGFFAARGYYPAGLELHYLLPPKSFRGKWYPPVIAKVQIDYGDIENEAELEIRRAWDLIQEVKLQGRYKPNRSWRNFLCSHKWCPFATACEEEFGGKVK